MAVQTPNTVLIGSGAGFAGDRIDAAVPVVRTLAKQSGPRYLIYEVLAERTLAIAQSLKREDPDKGYSPWMDSYLTQVVSDCLRHGVRIVANFGNANPSAAGARVQQMVRELGLTGIRVAVVEGDDLTAFMSREQILACETLEGTDTDGRELIAANAYLGARPIAAALQLGVDVVLVGRSTDAALVLGPLIHEFGWGENEYDLLAAGTMAGHLLECGAQVTGAYFADPGFKDVDGLADVGFPIAQISADGALLIGKADNTGGLVSRATVIEQLLYEMHDPSAYLTPDVVLDISGVTVEQVAPNQVRLQGARGHGRPDTLKATLSVDGGWLGEAEISYAGPNALARAQLAAAVVRKRCAQIEMTEPCRIEIIGTGTLFDDDSGSLAAQKFVSLDPAAEYRLRAAVRCASREHAERVCNEVLALYCCGPAAGGGVRQSLNSQVSTASVLLDRGPVEARVKVFEVMP